MAVSSAAVALSARVRSLSRADRVPLPPHSVPMTPLRPCHPCLRMRASHVASGIARTHAAPMAICNDACPLVTSLIGTAPIASGTAGAILSGMPKQAAASVVNVRRREIE